MNLISFPSLICLQANKRDSYELCWLITLVDVAESLHEDKTLQILT